MSKFYDQFTQPLCSITTASKLCNIFPNLHYSDSPGPESQYRYNEDKYTITFSNNNMSDIAILDKEIQVPYLNNSELTSVYFDHNKIYFQYTEKTDKEIKESFTTCMFIKTAGDIYVNIHAKKYNHSLFVYDVYSTDDMYPKLGNSKSTKKNITGILLDEYLMIDDMDTLESYTNRLDRKRLNRRWDYQTSVYYTDTEIKIPPRFNSSKSIHTFRIRERHYDKGSMTGYNPYSYGQAKSEKQDEYDESNYFPRITKYTCNYKLNDLINKLTSLMISQRSEVSALSLANLCKDLSARLLVYDDLDSSVKE